jgi:hypothetical protein
VPLAQSTNHDRSTGTYGQRGGISNGLVSKITKQGIQHYPHLHRSYSTLIHSSGSRLFGSGGDFLDQMPYERGFSGVVTTGIKPTGERVQMSEFCACAVAVQLIRDIFACILNFGRVY